MTELVPEVTVLRIKLVFSLMSSRRRVVVGSVGVVRGAGMLS